MQLPTVRVCSPPATPSVFRPNISLSPWCSTVFPCLFLWNTNTNTHNRTQFSVVATGMWSHQCHKFVVSPGVRVLIKPGPYPKEALSVKVISETRVSVVLASTNSVKLPTVNFGFPKQITDSSIVENNGNSKRLRSSNPSAIATYHCSWADTNRYTKLPFV